MTLPLKDLGRLGVRPHTHKVLVRLAREKGIPIQEFARQVLEGYVSDAEHDAKVVLGLAGDNPDDTEIRGTITEEHPVRRGGR